MQCSSCTDSSSATAVLAMKKAMEVQSQEMQAMVAATVATPVAKSDQATFSEEALRLLEAEQSQGSQPVDPMA
jgi:hypothetical protein